MTLLSVNNVAVEFGATTLLRDVSFTVGEGDRWGIIGRNGAGKTTLFRLITGQMTPTRGTIALRAFRGLEPEARWLLDRAPV